MKFLILLLTFQISILSETLYVTQSGAGSANGSSLGNAWSMSQLNNAANWGAGAGKVSAGDTVILNGIITSGLTLQGSGSVGNRIVIQFASGASMSRAHWNGVTTGNAAIYGNGLSYIEIDGGSNGFIEATANGTALANQLDCHGVRLDGDQTGNIIHNLTITNLYQRTPSSTDANYICNGIYFLGGNIQSCQIYSNITGNAGTGIQFSMGNGCAGNRINNNYCRKHGIAYNAGTTGAGVVADSPEIDHNNMSGDLTWSGNSGIHMNVEHTFAVQSGSQINNYKNHHNYYFGNMGVFPTSLHFLEGYIPNGIVYDNLYFHDTFSGGNGDFTIKGADGLRLMNLTFVNNTSGGNTAIGTTTWVGTEVFSMTNIIIRDYNFFFFDGSSGTAMSGADNCLIYPNTQQVRYGGATHTYAQWIATGKNGSGVTSNPNLDSNYAPQSGSPAIGTGANLSSFFTTDFNDVSRTVPWTIGAILYTGGGGGGSTFIPQLNPNTTLTGATRLTP